MSHTASSSQGLQFGIVTQNGITDQSTVGGLVVVGDTYIRSSQNKNLVIQSGNNSSAIYIDTSNNIGIGKNAPTEKIDINGFIKSSNGFKITNQQQPIIDENANLYLTGKANVSSDISTNGNLIILGTVNINNNLIVDTNTLYVDTSKNNVGIGTNSPSFPLDVIGTIRATTFSGSAANLSNINIANISGTLSADKGGTGTNTLTANALIVGNGTGSVIQSNNLTWNNNILSATTFSGSAANLSNINIANISGTLLVSYGGTSSTSLAANKILIGNGTNAILTSTNLHWDNVNNRLGIITASPMYSLDVSGNVKLANVYHFNVYRNTLGVNLNDGINLVTITGTTYLMYIDIIQNTATFNITKNYIVPVINNATNNTWLRLLPLYSSGVDTSGNDIAIDINVNQNVTTLRVTKLGNYTTITTSINCNLKIHQNQISPLTIVESTTSWSANATVSGYYSSTSLTQVNNYVGINNINPSYTLDVNGIINTTGGIRVNNNEVVDSDGNIVIRSLQLNDANGSSAFYINDSGYIGIGTDYPQTKVDISGTTTINGNLSLTNNSSSILFNNNNGGKRIILYSNANGAYSGIGKDTSCVTYSIYQTTDSHKFIAYNGSTQTELMRITGGGYVGIGTLNPSFTFDVNGNGRFILDVSANSFTVSNNLDSYTYYTTTNTSTIDWRCGASYTSNQGRFYISQKNSPFTGVYLISGSSSWTTSSDIRMKKNIQPLCDNALEKIININPIKYNWFNENNDERKHIGFSAQNVIEYLPDVVDINEYEDGLENKLSMRNTDIIPYLVQSIKELREEYMNNIKSLHNTVITLQNDINNLKIDLYNK